jgi:hypothetical protein
MFRRVALVRTDISEDRIVSNIRVRRIGEKGTRLAVSSYRSTQICELKTGSPRKLVTL